MSARIIAGRGLLLAMAAATLASGTDVLGSPPRASEAPLPPTQKVTREIAQRRQRERKRRQEEPKERQRREAEMRERLLRQRIAGGCDTRDDKFLHAAARRRRAIARGEL